MNIIIYFLWNMAIYFLTKSWGSCVNKKVVVIKFSMNFIQDKKTTMNQNGTYSQNFQKCTQPVLKKKWSSIVHTENIVKIWHFQRPTTSWHWYSNQYNTFNILSLKFNIWCKDCAYVTKSKHYLDKKIYIQKISRG